MNSIFGVRIVANPYLTVSRPTGRMLEHCRWDWRARLARNLGRPSTGRWEPLTCWYEEMERVPDPNIYVIQGRTMTGHPNVVAKIINAFPPPDPRLTDG